jgi:hypothetical protein
MMASKSDSIPNTPKKLKQNVANQEDFVIEDPFELPDLIKKHGSPQKLNDSKSIVDNDNELIKKVNI